LQKGRGKQEALRQAKLDYLASADPVEAHPYFWAGIIATGDMRPITGSSFAWMSWQLWGIAALLIWWFFSRLKWRNQ
ncbi:MAG: CHAT domain-containing protein, partial [Bacteroidota bacterium]